MDEFQIGIVGSAFLIGLVLIGVRVVYLHSRGPFRSSRDYWLDGWSRQALV